MIPHTGELRMLDSAFQNTACSRMGIALPFLAALGGRDFDCGLCKKLLHDEIGGHALTCTGIAKTARHNIIVRALADELSAPLSHTGAHVDRQHATYCLHGLIPKQPIMLSHRDIATHAADIAITEADRRTVLIDPTVTTPTVTPSEVNPARVPGFKAKAAEAKKEEKLQERFLVPDLLLAVVEFVPFGIESYGRLGAKAEAFLVAVARRAYPPVPLDSGGEWDVDGRMSIYVGRIRARVQIALAKGNEVMFEKFRLACPRR